MSKLTEAARGKSCIRCGVNDGTVVSCHMPGGSLRLLLGGGAGLKPPDIFCADLCRACHDHSDGRAPAGITRQDLDNEFARDVLRTIKRRVDEGLIVLP